MVSTLLSGHHLQRLFEKPDYQPAKGFGADGVEAVYIENEPYRGSRTTVFAWMGLPKLREGEQCPAMKEELRVVSDGGCEDGIPRPSAGEIGGAAET